jgi:hypothetical protein
MSELDVIVIHIGAGQAAESWVPQLNASLVMRI